MNNYEILLAKHFHLNNLLYATVVASFCSCWSWVDAMLPTLLLVCLGGLQGALSDVNDDGNGRNFCKFASSFGENLLLRIVWKVGLCIALVR